LAEISALQNAKIVYEAIVHRGVPCSEHASLGTSYVDCPHCLSGEQAQALGIPHDIENLGVIAESELTPEGADYFNIHVMARRGITRLSDLLRGNV
jgi:hypothetical protein